MVNPRDRERRREVLEKVHQAHTPLLTPSIDPLECKFARLLVKLPQTAHISADSEVVEVASDFSLQYGPPTLEFHRAADLFGPSDI